MFDEVQDELLEVLLVDGHLLQRQDLRPDQRGPPDDGQVTIVHRVHLTVIRNSGDERNQIYNNKYYSSIYQQ